MDVTVPGQMEATVSAKVIRADGTEESLGVISVTSVDAERVIALLEEIAPQAADLTPEEALAAANGASIKANEEHRQLLIDAGEEVT